MIRHETQSRLQIPRLQPRSPATRQHFLDRFNSAEQTDLSERNDPATSAQAMFGHTWGKANENMSSRCDSPVARGRNDHTLMLYRDVARKIRCKSSDSFAPHLGPSPRVTTRSVSDCYQQLTAREARSGTPCTAATSRSRPATLSGTRSTRGFSGLSEPPCFGYPGRKKLKLFGVTPPPSSPFTQYSEFGLPRGIEAHATSAPRLK
jgi:hypothetical protein